MPDLSTPRTSSGGILLFALLAAGCMERGVDRIRDPEQKAEFHCRYVLERALATHEEISPDGVLRRRIAVFAEPTVQREKDQVHFSWPAGSITRLGEAALHRGECVMDIRDGQQLVLSASLDGSALHSGFRF